MSTSVIEDPKAAPARRAKVWSVGASSVVQRLSVCALLGLAGTALLGLASSAAGLSAQAYESEFAESLPAIDARVWFDRGEDPVFDNGDRVRVYYRASEDAYVAIFHIDTDGQTRMVFPSSPRQTHYVRGGRDYRTLFDNSQYWFVDDQPGMGYFFIVASATPLDFSRIPYSAYERDWDLSRVGFEVRSDPYLAMDEYVAELVPDWEYGEYGLDYVEYSVDSQHAFPRFMCYDCHGYRPYYAWNPYAYSCTTFRVVLWDDPYYYPTTRYRGDRVVFVGRRPGTRPRYEFKERGRGDDGGRTSVVRRTGPQGTARRRSAGRGDLTSPRLRGSGGESVTRVPQSASGRPGARRTTPRPRTQVAPPRRSGGERTPVATRPSTRFRDSGAATDSGARRTRPTESETRGRAGSGDRTPVVRERPTTQTRSRPQLERRRPNRGSTAAPARVPRTRSDAQGRQRTPVARPGPSASTRTRSSQGSGSPARARPSPRSSGSTPRATPRQQPRNSGSSTPARVRPRPSGSSGSARAQPRRPAATPRSAPARSRPAVRPRRKPGGSDAG